MSARVLVADDEAPARRKVIAHLAGEQGAEVVGEAANGLEAVDAVRELRPDILFLDIQMPGMDGFEVLEAVGPRAVPAVVFVTAYDQYALKAFDVAAVDYLLKPFDAERFREAYRRALERVRTKTGEDALARLLDGVRPGPRRLSRLVVKREGRMLFVPIAEVVHLAARENYVEVFVAKGSYLIRETLSGFEARLDPEKFVRIHRSGLVNVDHVKEVQPWAHGDCVVILSNGDRVRLSRRYQVGLLGKPSGGA